MTIGHFPLPETPSRKYMFRIQVKIDQKNSSFVFIFEQALSCEADMFHNVRYSCAIDANRNARRQTSRAAVCLLAQTVNPSER
jgi:hypothetical protein